MGRKAKFIDPATRLKILRHLGRTQEYINEQASKVKAYGPDYMELALVNDALNDLAHFWTGDKNYLQSDWDNLRR